jgi:hypothetical protein
MGLEPPAGGRRPGGDDEGATRSQIVEQRFLAKHHRDEVQGFYFGKPGSPEVFAKLLARDRGRIKRSPCAPG